MPRCYTIKKINAQQRSIQQYCANNLSNGGDGDGGVCNNKPSGAVAAIRIDHNCKNRLKGGKKSGRIAINGKSNSDSTRDGNDGEWKTAAVQRKKLLNTTSAAVHQQEDPSCPTSPTEGTVAPIYYNSNAHETKACEYHRNYYCISSNS